MLLPWTMSGCFVGPYAAPSSPPVDCAIELYQRTEDVGTDGPKLWVFRNGIELDVTGPVNNLGQVDLGLTVATVDCDGNVLSTSRQSQLYNHYTFTLAGARVGETLWTNWGGWSEMGVVQVAANGTCPEPMPTPEPVCSGNYDPCLYGDADGGVDPGGRPPDVRDPFRLPSCNAGGGSSGLIVALALLAVRRRRTR